MSNFVGSSLAMRTVRVEQTTLALSKCPHWRSGQKGNATLAMMIESLVQSLLQQGAAADVPSLSDEKSSADRVIENCQMQRAEAWSQNCYGHNDVLIADV